MASYSEIDSLFVTNRFEPDRAMPSASSNLEIKESFTTAPVVTSYTPIVVKFFTTKRFDPDMAMAVGLGTEIKEAFTTAPVVASYTPIVPLLP